MPTATVGVNSQKSGSAGAREKINRYAYLPFGAGPRICIGATFALQEATLVLGTIMRHFRLQLAPGFSIWPLQRVTLRPRGGLPMLITARNPETRPIPARHAARAEDARAAQLMHAPSNYRVWIGPHGGIVGRGLG